MHVVLKHNIQCTPRAATTDLFCADCSGVGSCRAAMTTNGCHVMN
jgi:hypothetical protein